MTTKNVVAKDWSTWLPSFDGLIYSLYPAGDKPAGFQASPTLIKTNCKAISLVNNYNGKGGWFRLYGYGFGRTSTLGTASGARVYLRDPLGDNLWHEVYSYLSLKKSLVYSVLQVQVIEVQVGDLGGGITAGRALDVKITVNSVDTNILTGRIVSQPGDFYFVDNNLGLDSTGTKNDPTKPYRYWQFYAGGANFTGVFAPGVMKGGDTLVPRAGTWADQVGYDGRLLRFAIGTGTSTDAINGGSVPTGTVGHGYVNIYPYPGEDVQGNFATGGGIHGCEGARALAGQGKYVNITGLGQFQIGASGNRDATAINLQNGADHWMVYENKSGPFPSTVTGVNSAKTAGIVGQGDSIECYFNECFGYASTSTESHGLYFGGTNSGGFDAATTNLDCGYNWIHDCVGGSGIQLYWQTGVNSAFFTGNKVHHNYIDTTVKYGINNGQSSVSGDIYDNIVVNTGLSPIRFECPNGQVLAINVEYNTFFNWNTTSSIADSAVLTEGFVTSGAVNLRHNVFTAKAGRAYTANWYANNGAGDTNLAMDQNRWWDLAGTLTGVPTKDTTNGISGDPNFTSVSTGNYTRTSGADSTTTEAISGIVTDIYGISRPQGAHKWIGATEGNGT